MGSVSYPRAHHYVPKTYLAGFTNAKDVLFVTHKRSGKVRPSKPINEANERDYYLLDYGDDLLAIENFFSQLESRWPQVRSAIFENHGLPESAELRGFLMGFMAAQFMRVPGTLDGWGELHEHVLKNAAWNLVATPESWAEHVKRMREAGDQVPDVSYDEMRKFIFSEEYSIALDKNSLLGPLFNRIPGIAKILSQRTWTLVEAEQDYITSDRPLTACWNESNKGFFPPPGLAVPSTAVLFPVTSRAVLVGMFEGPFPVTKANEVLLGTLNMWTGFYATRFVYSRSEDFRVVLPDGRHGGRREFVEHVSREPKGF